MIVFSQYPVLTATTHRELCFGLTLLFPQLFSRICSSSIFLACKMRVHSWSSFSLHDPHCFLNSGADVRAFCMSFCRSSSNLEFNHLAVLLFENKNHSFNWQCSSIWLLSQQSVKLCKIPLTYSISFRFTCAHHNNWRLSDKIVRYSKCYYMKWWYLHCEGTDIGIKLLP